MSDVATEVAIKIAKAFGGMKKNDFVVESAALSSSDVPRWPKDCKKRSSSTMTTSDDATDVEIIAAAETLMLMKKDAFAPQEEPAPLSPHLSEERMCQLIDALGGTYNRKFIFQKNLRETDVKKVENRLNMPCDKVDDRGFLTDDEKQTLNKGRGETRYPAIIVRLIEPSGDESCIHLKRWKIGKIQNYVLTTEWHALVQKHEIKAGTNVRILSFRYDHGKLGMALQVRSSPGTM